MNWEKLEVYIARKELSAKAIKEAADIWCGIIIV